VKVRPFEDSRNFIVAFISLFCKKGCEYIILQLEVITICWPSNQ